jgi:centrosomal protein CEP104
LSHQSKIASKIELFTFIPSGEQAMTSQIPLNEVKFNRLGYLSLESNEKSGFQARELKSVYVDAFSLLLKIVLHKCHVNKFNLYNQVGLIAINCMGEISKAKQAVTDPDNATFEEMMQLDELTLERVKALKAAKDKAIKMEDYDEAKRLKEAIERLRSMGTHLAQLEERKKIAIENEDFDAAKIIKTEIDRLRQTALDPAYNQGPYSKQPKPTEAARPFSGGPDAPLADEMPPPRKKPDVFGGGPGIGGGPGMGGIQKGMEGMSMDPPPKRGQPALPLNNKKDLFGPGPGKAPGGGGGIQFPASDEFEEEEKKMAMPMAPKQPVNIDEQVIPAARNRGQTPEDGGITSGANQEVTEAEEITGDNIKIAQPLIPVFGEHTMRRLFSKNWANRENALDETIEVLNSNPDPDTVTGALGVAAQGIKDKIGQVVLKTFELLNTILAVHQEPAPSDAKFYVEEVVSNVVNRVGDNNGRIREKALETGLELSAHPIAGHNMVIDHITRKPSKKGASQSVKQQTGKYKYLSEILRNTPVSKPAEQRTCMTFCVAGFKNSSKEIRDNAYNCIIELYRVMGSSIWKFLDDLRPAQKELLENGFNEVDGIDPNDRQDDDKPRVTVETNISPYGAKKGKSKGPSGPAAGDLDMLGESPQKFESSFKADNDNMCQFCGKYEMGWSQEELDMHFWRDCAMLTPCFGCGQVLAISDLNDHLMSECENGSEFQQCPRCKEPVPNDEYNFHTEEGL